MMDSGNEKMGFKFWLMALALSVLMMATTFALMSVYLIDIKNNAEAANMRAETAMQRLVTLELELSAIHRHLLTEKVASMAAAAGQEVPLPPAPSGISIAPSGISINPPAADTAPVIHTPVMLPVPSTAAPSAKP